MATQASDVIRATTEILRSGRESEEFKVQTALAMLGLRHQMKLADAELAGKQLGVLESTNIQQMQSQARTFLTVTGFNQWYNPEDEEWAEAMVDDLTEAPKIKQGVNVGGYGFSQTDAVRIAGAVQSFYLQSPEGILEIADELSGKVTAGTEDSLVRGFKSVGVFSPDRKEKFHQQLAGISKTLENREMIVAEKYEYGKGDFKIQRDIAQVGKVELPTTVPGVGDDALAESSEISGVFGEEIKGLLDEIDVTKGQVGEKEKTLRSLGVQISAAKAKQRAGLSLTETQEALISDEVEAMKLIENDISALNASISDKRERGLALKRLNMEEAIRSGEVGMLPAATHFGIDPLQKFGLWAQTGVWPEDELLRAAEDISEKKRKSVPPIKWDPPKL